MRVGGSRIIHVDVRIVAATNEQLEEKVADGSFRQDLYYRLNTLPVWIPPLRERGEDIFLILEHFRREMGGAFVLSPEIRRLFREYLWHGNVRELRNVAEYLNFTGRHVITERELPPAFLGWKRRGREVPAGEGRSPGFRPALTEENGTGARKLVLELLFEARQDGRPIGREGILKGGAERGQHLTQPQVRAILKSLEQEGCAEIRRGRGGTVITEKGIQTLRAGTEHAGRPEE